MEVTDLLNGKKVNKAWEQWLALDDWDVFATLNFGHLSLLEGNRTDAAGKLWRSCLATLDRAIYGHVRKNQPRFNRVAFRQYGANGTNPHVHIIAKSPIELDEFCIAWNAIWATKFTPAASPITNSIAPLITTTGATGYGQHEEFQNDTGSFDDRLSYTNSGTQHLVRTDALQRLHSQAKQEQLIKARLALPEHIRKSQAKHELRRKRKKMAALLRL